MKSSFSLLRASGASRVVEQCTLPKFSGITKFRLSLAVLGMLAFFPSANYIGYFLRRDTAPLALLDNGYYLVHNLMLAGFTFSMVPLADFQVFEYDSKFWNIFKSLAAYYLLAETEAIVQFVYECSSISEAEVTDLDLDILLNLFIFSLLRWSMQVMLHWKGCAFVAAIVHCRSLPTGTYVSFSKNVLEYAVLHSLGLAQLALLTDCGLVRVLANEALLLFVYILYRDFLPSREQPFYKVA